MAARRRHAHKAPSGATVRNASWKEDLPTLQRLFQEYRQWLAEHSDTEESAAPKVSAGLAEIDALVRGLPGAYGPPHGDVLLWSDGKGLAAIGALRQIEPGVGELKRIFVRADYRGPDFGKPWVQTMLRRARELGYRRVRADTLPTMAAAIEFYQESGFRPISAFWPHPVSGALFFEYEIPK